MERNNEKYSQLIFVDKRFNLWQSLIITGAVMAALIFFVFHFQIPNPNMILIAGLVICSALFGYSGGILAAVIMIFYSLYFFSDNNSFVHFSDENMRKVMVSLFGIIVDMVFVCSLKRRENAAFYEIRALSEQLSKENDLLQTASMTDTLTGIGNRLALRRDFDSYLNTDLHVIMLDIDNFKMVNDRYGHLSGDRALADTGKLIASQFGTEHCYRYGGDEFMMVVPEMSRDEVRNHIDYLMSNQPVIEDDPEKRPINYSIGYCSGNAANHFELSVLLNKADELMYEAKTSGKNKVVCD